jgi:hypothetical protein
MSNFTETCQKAGRAACWRIYCMARFTAIMIAVLAVLAFLTLGGLDALRERAIGRAQAVDRTEKRFVVPGGQVLVLDVQNDVGDIQVRVATNIQGRVQATKWARALNAQAAEQALDNLQVNIVRRGNSLTVRTSRTGGPAFFSPVADLGVDLLFEVPHSTDILIRNGRGNVSVRGTGGRLEVWNDIGNVEAIGVVPGTKGLRITTGRGNVTFGGPLVYKGLYELDTGLGIVGLGLPADSKFFVAANAGVGLIRNQFTLRSGGESRRGLGDSLHGQVGDAGETELRLRVDLGMIGLQPMDMNK